MLSEARSMTNSPAPQPRMSDDYMPPDSSLVLERDDCFRPKTRRVGQCVERFSERFGVLAVIAAAETTGVFLRLRRFPVLTGSMTVVATLGGVLCTFVDRDGKLLNGPERVFGHINYSTGVIALTNGNIESAQVDYNAFLTM
jgi:hypothetical protein